MDEEQKLLQFITYLKKHNVLKIKEYKKGDLIADYMENRDRIFILESGSADLIKYDRNGNQYILQHIYTNDLFGEAFQKIAVSGEYSVIAQEPCTVYIFPLYQTIEKLCGRADPTPFILLLNGLCNKFEAMSYQIEILSQRTVRDRLLTYFESLASRNYQRVFYIPMNYSQLANYLSIDRSAMMREIKSLEDEGFIDRHKYRIRLLTNQ